MKEQFIKTKNTDVFVKTLGEGKTILFLHGWGVDSTYFNEIKDFLSNQSFKLVFLDFPGFGSSSVPNEEWNLDDYVEVVENIIKKLELDNINIVAHSFGARVAIKLCSKKRTDINKLILCGAAGLPEHNSLKKVAFKSLAKTGKKIFELPLLKNKEDKARKLLYKLARVNDYEKANSMMKKIMVNIIKEDLTPDLKQIQQKTLLVWGKRDTYTPLYNGIKMNKLIKNSKLEVLDKATHSLIRTNPEKFIQFILPFIKN